MNKKGMIITYLPFKKYLIFIAIIVVLSLIYYFFVMHSAGLISIKTTCPDGIIPQRFNINHVDNSWSLAYKNDWLFPIQNPSAWKDGSEVDIGYYTGNCHLGNKEGENVNYLYCNEIPYRKKQVNSDGTIGKLVDINIDLVLDSNDIIQKEKDLGEIGHAPYNISALKVVDYKCNN
jgi:hypothetical protein